MHVRSTRDRSPDDLRRLLARTLLGIDAPDDLAWEPLQRLAAEHELDASVSLAVARADHADPPVRQRARADLAVRAMLEDERLRRLAPVLRTLAANDIDTLVLKGHALRAVGLLPAGARATRDVDLLVRPSQVRRADAILAALGGGHPAWVSWISFDGRPLSRSFLQKKHSTLPRVLDTVLVVDLHGALPGRERRAERDFELLLRDSVDGSLAGEVVRAPSLPHLRFLLEDHVAGHHLWEPHHRSRHLADLLTFEPHLSTPPGAPVPGLGRPAGGPLHARFVADVRRWAHGEPVSPWSLAHGFAARHPRLDTPRAAAETALRWLDDLRVRPTLPLRKLLPHPRFFAWSLDRASIPPRELLQLRIDRLRGRLPVSPYERRLAEALGVARDDDPSLPLTRREAP